MNAIKEIVVLVELANGHAYQVLTSQDVKRACLGLMEVEGRLLLSEPLKPIRIEPLKANVRGVAPATESAASKQNYGLE